MDRNEAKQMGTEVLLPVAVTQVADALKEQELNIFSEILTDTVASAIPGLGGALTSYKTPHVECVVLITKVEK